jgi:glyoxylase-like metal-dependent hydrolase (beta-lactamase superfamily II)
MTHRIQRAGFVNFYLVEEDDGLTLIDTAIGGSAKAILAAAADLGRPIVRIVLTHAHGDHIGSLDALHEQLPDAEVLIGAREVPLLKKDLHLEPGEPRSKIKGSLPGAATEPTRTLVPGDRVGSLQAIAAPGHTPGQMAFLDTRDDTLYCADVFTTWGRVVATTAVLNPRFPLASPATWDRPTEVATARALRALDPARIAPGHGKVVESPGAAMDRAIAKAAAS